AKYTGVCGVVAVGTRHAGNAKVEKMNVALFGQQHIVRGHVTVNDFNLVTVLRVKVMRVVQSVKNPAHDVKTHINRHRETTDMPEIEPRSQRVTVHILQHHDVRSVFNPKVDDVCDARVLHFGEDLSLSLEETISFVRHAEITSHSLDPHLTSETLGGFDASKMDRPHPPFAELPHNSVTA